ncbi:MAG: hypothetical protein AB2A00_05540 [Myxococcota bacterium]
MNGTSSSVVRGALGALPVMLLVLLGADGEKEAVGLILLLMFAVLCPVGAYLAVQAGKRDPNARPVKRRRGRGHHIPSYR